MKQKGILSFLRERERSNTFDRELSSRIRSQGEQTREGRKNERPGAVGKMGKALTDQLSDGSSGRGRETKDSVSYKRVYFVPLGPGSDNLTLHPIPTAPPCFSVIEREALC